MNHATGAEASSIAAVSGARDDILSDAWPEMVPPRIWPASKSIEKRSDCVDDMPVPLSSVGSQKKNA